MSVLHFHSILIDSMSQGNFNILQDHKKLGLVNVDRSISCLYQGRYKNC